MVRALACRSVRFLYAVPARDRLACSCGGNNSGTGERARILDGGLAWLPLGGRFGLRASAVVSCLVAVPRM